MITIWWTDQRATLGMQQGSDVPRFPMDGSMSPKIEAKSIGPIDFDSSDFCGTMTGGASSIAKSRHGSLWKAPRVRRTPRTASSPALKSRWNPALWAVSAIFKFGRVIGQGSGSLSSYWYTTRRQARKLCRHQNWGTLHLCSALKHVSCLWHPNGFVDSKYEPCIMSC